MANKTQWASSDPRNPSYGNGIELPDYITSPVPTKPPAFSENGSKRTSDDNQWVWYTDPNTGQGYWEPNYRSSLLSSAFKAPSASSAPMSSPSPASSSGPVGTDTLAGILRSGSTVTKVPSVTGLSPLMNPATTKPMPMTRVPGNYKTMAAASNAAKNFSDKWIKENTTPATPVAGQGTGMFTGISAENLPVAQAMMADLQNKQTLGEAATKANVETYQKQVADAAARKERLMGMSGQLDASTAQGKADLSKLQKTVDAHPGVMDQKGQDAVKATTDLVQSQINAMQSTRDSMLAKFADLKGADMQSASAGVDESTRNEEARIRAEMGDPNSSPDAAAAIQRVRMLGAQQKMGILDAARTKYNDNLLNANLSFANMEASLRGAMSTLGAGAITNALQIASYARQWSGEMSLNIAKLNNTFDLQDVSSKTALELLIKQDENDVNSSATQLAPLAEKNSVSWAPFLTVLAELRQQSKNELQSNAPGTVTTGRMGTTGNKNKTAAPQTQGTPNMTTNVSQSFVTGMNNKLRTAPAANTAQKAGDSAAPSQPAASTPATQYDLGGLGGKNWNDPSFAPPTSSSAASTPTARAPVNGQYGSALDLAMALGNPLAGAESSIRGEYSGAGLNGNLRALQAQTQLLW